MSHSVKNHHQYVYLNFHAKNNVGICFFLSMNFRAKIVPVDYNVDLKKLSYHILNKIRL